MQPSDCEKRGIAPFFMETTNTAGKMAHFHLEKGE